MIDSTSASGAGATLDPRVEHTRSQVHAAVLGLLQEEGLQAVTHANVAARAPVSRATVYRHFPDRASLLVSTLDAMKPSIELPAPTGVPREDARAMLEVVARHLNDNEMLVDLLVLLREADHDPDFAVARHHVFPLEGDAAQDSNPAVAVIAAGRRSGRIREDVDPLVAAATLMGPVIGLRVMLRQTLTSEILDGIVDVWARGVEAD